MDGTHSLDGRRILVVEDDYALALDMCNDLRRHGATVLGPAPTPHYAGLLLMGRGVDGAVLDIKLYGSNVFDFARLLRRKHVPFVFTSGTSRETAPPEFKDAPWLQKPILEDTLLSAIKAELDGSAGARTGSPAAMRPGPDRREMRVPRPVRVSSQERWLRAVSRAFGRTGGGLQWRRAAQPGVEAAREVESPR